MAQVNFDGVKITSEFSSEVGTLASGETLPSSLGKIAGHISNGGNPHNVTASQVGAYTKSETDSAIAAAKPVNATASAAGLMSVSDKSKLDGITASADTVAFTQSLTSGTQVGTITINGTATKLYCQTNTNTTYSAGTGISLSGTTFSNSGVRSVATGSSNGTISVNTNGTSANVSVKGLAAAAYQAIQTAVGTAGIHKMSAGSSAATTSNCPAGAWYGQW